MGRMQGFVLRRWRIATAAIGLRPLLKAQLPCFLLLVVVVVVVVIVFATVCLDYAVNGARIITCTRIHARSKLNAFHNYKEIVIIEVSRINIILIHELKLVHCIYVFVLCQVCTARS